MTDPKVEIVQSYLAAARRGDTNAMLAAFADDLVYVVHGTGPLAGETCGRRAAVDYYGRIMALTDGSYAITGIVDWLVSETRVALIATETAARLGSRLDFARIILFEFRGAAIARVTLFDDRQGELDALLSA